MFFCVRHIWLKASFQFDLHKFWSNPCMESYKLCSKFKIFLMGHFIILCIYLIWMYSHIFSLKFDLIWEKWRFYEQSWIRSILKRNQTLSRKLFYNFDSNSHVIIIITCEHVCLSDCVEVVRITNDVVQLTWGE